MSDPRAISGAPEVARLLAKAHSPHCKLTVNVNGLEVAFSGTMVAARHFLTVLEAQLDVRLEVARFVD